MLLVADSVRGSFIRVTLACGHLSGGVERDRRQRSGRAIGYTNLVGFIDTAKYGEIWAKRDREGHWDSRGRVVPTPYGTNRDHFTMTAEGLQVGTF